MQSWTLAPGSALLSAVALTACGDPSAVNAAGAGGAPGTDTEYLTELVTRDDYTSLAGEGAEVKYLTIVDGREPPAMFAGAACLFQNTDDHPYHVQFLRTFPEYAALAPERYADMVLRRASRVMWGGGLKLYPATPHPLTGAAGVLAYTVYSEAAPDALLTVHDIVQADRRLKGCSPFAERFLVFSPDGSAQTAAVQAIADELVAAGVALVDPDTLLSGLSAETYSEGEAYGYLKIVDGAAAGSAGPRDVLVIDEAPSDLGLVAGRAEAWLAPRQRGEDRRMSRRPSAFPAAPASSNSVRSSVSPYRIAACGDLTPSGAARIARMVRFSGSSSHVRPDWPTAMTSSPVCRSTETSSPSATSCVALPLTGSRRTTPERTSVNTAPGPAAMRRWKSPMWRSSRGSSEVWSTTLTSPLPCATQIRPCPTARANASRPSSGERR